MQNMWFAAVLAYWLVIASGADKQAHGSAHASTKHLKAKAAANGPFLRMRRHMLSRHRHHKERLNPSEDDLEAMGLGSFFGASSHQVGETVVRPTAGGDADVVKFGLFAKNYHGADLKSNTFRVDLVITTLWKDPRVVKVLPENLERLVLSKGQAGGKIWMPHIVVTNRDMGAYNVISSEVQIFKTGTVEKVDRVQVRASNNFELNTYPFDTQEFRVKIASSKYMVEDVLLEPLGTEGSSGLNKDMFAGTSYEVEKWTTSVYEEADGNLMKSRGMLEIVVSRNLDKYSQDHLVPTGISLMVSWAVFYVPFSIPFITPRLMLSVITLLTFTNLMIKSGSQLPGAAPFNWNDLFNQFVQWMMFLTIVLNITSEVMHHQLKVEGVAQKVNHESKILLPMFSLTMIAMILGFGNYEIMTLNHTTKLTHAIVLIWVIGYGYWCWARFRREQMNKQFQARGDGA